MSTKQVLRITMAGALAGLAVGSLFFAGEMLVGRARGGFLAAGWPLTAILPYYWGPGVAGGLFLAWALQIVPRFRKGRASTGIGAGVLLAVGFGLVYAGWQMNLHSPGSPAHPPDLYFNLALVVAAAAMAGTGVWGILRLPRAAWLAPGVFVIAAGAAFGVGAVAVSPPPLDSAVTHAPQGKPNLLLITVDTLRRDHVSVNGYPRNTTPTLDRIALEGINFSQAIAPASITVRSMTSLFTSLLPSMHGSQNGLPPGVPHLFSTLRDQGYLVAGFATENTAVYTNGIAEGLDHTDRCWNLAALTPVAVLYRAGVLSSRQYNRLLVPPAGHVVVGKALDFASRHHDRPLVLWVHLMDVHSPYHSPDGFDNRFGDPLSEGPSDDELNERLTRLTHRESDMFMEFYRNRDFESMERDLDQTAHFTADELARMIALYDGGIAYADSQIDRLLRGLGDLGVLDDCLTAVTSDHGEGFLEHGRVFHSGDYLYDELIRVPLMLHRPGVLPAGLTITSQASLVDVFPTLLGQLGITPPKGADDFVGHDLTPYLTADMDRVQRDAFHPHPAVSEGAYITSVRTENFKFIDCSGHDRLELYDLATDPGEQENLYELRPYQATLFTARVDSVAQVAAGFITAHPLGTATQVDEATRERLRALGYIQ